MKRTKRVDENIPHSIEKHIAVFPRVFWVDKHRIPDYAFAGWTTLSGRAALAGSATIFPSSIRSDRCE